MNNEDIEERYKVLAKEHCLPDFESINLEFEVRYVEDEEFLLRNIRRKMIEKVSLYSKFLEATLQPEATVAELHECKEYDDVRKKKMFILYGQLVMYQRDSLILDLELDDSKESAFISRLFSAWQGIKKDLISYVQIAKGSWEKDDESHVNPGYFG